MSLSIEVSSPVGRAALLQVLSAILIMGTIAMPVVTLHVGFMWFLVLGGLWIIAFLQMLVVRGVLQKEGWGVSAALVVSIIALLLSVMAGFSWFSYLFDIFTGAYFIVIGIVNMIAAFFLGEVRRNAHTKQ
ncbi:MAG: hypothetical protein ACXAB0_01050 [Candidatus Thorarchaeota archaeon]|jgi:hypothetical protein